MHCNCAALPRRCGCPRKRERSVLWVSDPTGLDKQPPGNKHTAHHTRGTTIQLRSAVRSAPNLPTTDYRHKHNYNKLMVLPKHRKDEFCARVLCGGAVVCVLLGHPHRAALNARVGRTLGFSNGWYLSTRTSPPTHTHRHTHTNSFTRNHLPHVQTVTHNHTQCVGGPQCRCGAVYFGIIFYIFFEYLAKTDSISTRCRTTLGPAMCPI